MNPRSRRSCCSQDYLRCGAPGSQGAGVALLHLEGDVGLRHAGGGGDDPPEAAVRLASDHPGTVVAVRPAGDADLAAHGQVLLGLDPAGVGEEVGEGRAADQEGLFGRRMAVVSRRVPGGAGKCRVHLKDSNDGGC